MWNISDKKTKTQSTTSASQIMYAPDYVFMFNSSILFWYPPFSLSLEGRLLLLFFGLFIFLFLIFPFSIPPFPILPFSVWKTKFSMNYHCRILITNLLWSTSAHFTGYMGGWYLQYRVDSHSTFSYILHANWPSIHLSSFISLV